LDATVSTFNVELAAGQFQEVKLHQRPEILQRTGALFYSVEATATTPFITSMTHYDLVLGGGWATQGTPFGIINDLSKIA
jgi:hypothetical protein